MAFKKRMWAEMKELTRLTNDAKHNQITKFETAHCQTLASFAKMTTKPGYGPPFDPISDAQIEEWKRQIRISDRGTCLAFQIDHPYYRELLREEADKREFPSASFYNPLCKLNNDNSLIRHYHCQQTYHETLVTWKRDPLGLKTGKYFVCPMCSDGMIVYSKDQGDENSPFGYERIEGDNYLAVGANVFILMSGVKEILKRSIDYIKNKQIN